MSEMSLHGRLWVVALLAVVSSGGVVWGQVLERMAADALPWAGDVGFAAQRVAILERIEAEGSSDVLLFELARVEHLLGARGDRELAKSSLKSLEGLAERYPDDAVVKGYLGSATMLRASRVWWFMTKGKLVERGGGLLEEAVRLSPRDAELHALAGASVEQLPGWMDQGARAEEEVELAYRLMVEAEDAEARWTGAVRALIAETYGRLCERRGDVMAARDAYGLAVEVAPDSDSGKAAAQRILSLGD
ncbi:MAG: hypothetical protein RIG82_04880 [Phycisphaeraceae bacterium]